MTYARSTHLCPACGKPLAKELMTVWPLETLVSLWCPEGKCQSEICSKGTEGQTEQEAYNQLITRYDERNTENE